MNRAIVSLARQEGFQRRLVADVDPLEVDAGRGRQLADALENRGLGVAEVVDDADGVPRLREQYAGMRADVAEPARNEDATGYVALPGFSVGWSRMRA